MGIETAGLVIACFAVVISIAAYVEAARQSRLSASSAVADWLRDIRSWASEAVDVLTESAYLTEVADSRDSHDDTTALLECRHRISSLVECGRFLLPNERPTELGEHKPPAYRGYRHYALDPLVAAEQIVGGEMTARSFPDRKSALVALRREFVSTIQSIIDPAAMNDDMARLLWLASKSRAADPTLGGLFPNGQDIPPGAHGILEIAGRRERQRCDR